MIIMSRVFRYATLSRRFHIKENINKPLSRSISVSTNMRSGTSEFEAAKERVTKLSNEPDNNVKLQLYALFKQSTIGHCNIPKPSVMDFVGKAKWQAWMDLKDMAQDDARSKYIGLVDSLVQEEKGDRAVATGTTPSPGRFETLITDSRDGIYRITLNRPSKLNAITMQMYEEWIEALREAADDENCRVAVTTGAGDYYCSGNDLSVFASALKSGSSLAENAKTGSALLKRFVQSFIDFPKPIVGAVNGPAVGVSVTVLGLYDAVYASDRATFNTPFTHIAQSAEGCSTYAFPRIMGHTKACGMLLFNEKITAQEACDRGFVTTVIPHDSFQHVVDSRLSEMAKLPRQSVLVGKKLIRDSVRQDLTLANERECDALIERWQSQECMNALMAFSTRKSKI